MSTNENKKTTESETEPKEGTPKEVVLDEEALKQASGGHPGKTVKVIPKGTSPTGTGTAGAGGGNR